MVIQILMLLFLAQWPMPMNQYAWEFDKRNPWDVAVERRQVQNLAYFTGVVVSNNFIMTAGHLLYGAERVDVYVECFSNKKDIYVSANPDQIFLSKDVNLGMIVFREGLKSNYNVKPIPLATECPKERDSIFYRNSYYFCETTNRKMTVMRTLEHVFSHSKFFITNIQQKNEWFDGTSIYGIAVMDENNRLNGIMTNLINSEIEIVCVSRFSDVINDEYAALRGFYSPNKTDTE